MVGATRPIVDDLDSRVQANAEWVPNGWDPADEANASAAESVAQSDPSIVYTGTLRVRNFDPEPLLRALSIVREEGNALKLTIAGTITSADQDLVDKLGLTNGIQYLGTVGRSASLALQRSGNALLLVSARDRSVATSKLFEYFGAGKPILALAEGNEAARLIRETSTGITVAPDDVDAIADGLRRVVTGEIASSFAPRNLEAFTYPGPAEAMARLVETALERHAGSRH